MYEKYLPIGTVVILKGGKKRIMISGFCCKSDKENKNYDYCGLLFPEGYIKSDLMLLFNHDQIEKIFYLGLNDDENKEFHSNLQNFLKKEVE